MSLPPVKVAPARTKATRWGAFTARQRCSPTVFSTKELAEYLGHSDPAFTLRVYAHMLPCSHDRARAVISERFSRSDRFWQLNVSVALSQIMITEQ